MWFKKPRPLDLNGGIVFTYTEPYKKEDELVNAWLDAFPNEAFIVPGGGRMYVRSGSRVIRFIGVDFRKLSDEEVDHIIDGVRSIV